MTEYERTTYDEMKEWFLGCVYRYCYNTFNKKRHGHIAHPSMEEMYLGAIGYAYEELELTFNMPVEKMMLEIIPLILKAGYSYEEYHRGMIKKILSENRLDALTSDLDEDEKKSLLKDLSLLDLI